MSLDLIAEIHPQHGGTPAGIREAIRAAKLGGATVAKIQLYDAGDVFGAPGWEYLEVAREDLPRIKRWCDEDEIEFMASVFDSERVDWLEDVGVDRYKIASRSVKDDPEMCHKIIEIGKETIISLGMWDGADKPFGTAPTLKYLYCVSKYPAYWEDMGDFPADFAVEGLAGYSDHTFGIDACLLAIARGATIVEKHFTLDKMRTKDTEMAHICSMTPDELAELSRVGGSLLRTRRAVEAAGG